MIHGVTASAYIAGLLIAVPLAAGLVPLFVYACEWFLDLHPPDKRWQTGFVTGLFERFWTFLLFAHGVPWQGAATILVAWMAAKLAINWHRPPYEGWEGREREYRERAFVGLMAGALSIAFGVLGGLLTASLLSATFPAN